MDATSLLLSATSRLTPTCHDMMQIDVLIELLDKLLEQAEARELGHNFRSLFGRRTQRPADHDAVNGSEPDPLRFSPLCLSLSSLCSFRLTHPRI